MSLFQNCAELIANFDVLTKFGARPATVPTRRCPPCPPQQPRPPQCCWTPGSVSACGPRGRSLGASPASCCTSSMGHAWLPWSCSSRARCPEPGGDKSVVNNISNFKGGWFHRTIATEYGLAKMSMYHVEPKEAVTEKHLDLLVVSWEITMWVAPIVLVATAPLITAWCQFVCGQWARSWGKAACQNDALLTIPLLVVLQNLSMRCQVLQGTTERTVQ